VAEYQKVAGLRELGERLMALPKEISGKNGGPLLKTLRRMGAVIQKDAQSRVRVKTGTLRDNIIVTRKRKQELRPGEEGVEVTIRARAKKYADNKKNRASGRVGGQYKTYGPLFYARFLEFGTSHQPATPFLTPAFEAAKPRLPEMFKTEMARAIDEAVKKLARKKL
jgi:HK97 gp10 family phage protein